MIDALGQIEGAYSLVCAVDKKLIGCRDPLGVRPLVLGELDGAPILASETCALDIIGATLRARDRARRDGHRHHRRRHRERSNRSPPRRVALLHLRVRLFRPAGFDRRRPQRLRGAQADRRGACPRERRSTPTSSCRCPIQACPAAIGFAEACGHPLRSRHHPQPLCRAHLHRADRRHPPHGRAAQAQRQPRRPRRASAWCWSTIRSCAARPR